MSQGEIEESLTHHEEMVRVLTRRYRDRERQAAYYGIDVPPHISAEIDSLANEIEQHQVTIQRLEGYISDITKRDFEKSSLSIKSAILGAVLVLFFFAAIYFLSQQSKTATNQVNSNSTDRSLSGEWRGILTDETDTQFDYTLSLSQTGDQVIGTSVARFKNPSLSQYYMSAAFKGIIHNDVLEFDEIDFIANYPEPGGIWCLASGTLRYDNKNHNEQMLGRYQDQHTTTGCGFSGTIELVKSGQ